ncbi:MAG: hypothetical protein ACQER9_01525 [Nanobdellota archaeon]
MFSNKRKRGSISLSINMIVVVVLAFVMLGLMLGLGRSIVNSASETANQVSEQTKQDITNKITQSDKPLYFLQREFDVGFGKKKTLAFGVKNVDASSTSLKIEIEAVTQDGQTILLDPKKRVQDGDEYGAFFWPNIAQQFGAGESKIFDVQYRPPKGAKDETFMYKFSLMNPEKEDPVAEQIIMINIV